MGDEDENSGQYISLEEKQKQMILELRKHGKDALEASKWLLSQIGIAKFVGRQFP